jgi:hypothetical protein
MTLFFVLSASVALILLLCAAVPLWVWIELARKRIDRRR